MIIKWEYLFETITLQIESNFNILPLRGDILLNE